MKISELILELSKHLSEQGDIQVFFPSRAIDQDEYHVPVERFLIESETIPMQDSQPIQFTYLLMDTA